MIILANKYLIASESQKIYCYNGEYVPVFNSQFQLSLFSEYVTIKGQVNCCLIKEKAIPCLLDYFIEQGITHFMINILMEPDQIRFDLENINYAYYRYRPSEKSRKRYGSQNIC